MRYVYFVMLLAICSFHKATAQNKKRVPFDSGEKIYVIDKKLEARLNLFPGVNNFIKATAFQLNDTSYQVEILSENQPVKVAVLSENQYFKIQAIADKYLSTNTTDRSQPAVNTKAINTGVNNSNPNDGRRYLTRSIRGLALFGYGWMIPAGLQINDASGFLGGYLMVAGGAILFPYLLTPADTIPLGAASLFSGAAILGIAHGFLLQAAATDQIDTRVWLTSTGMSLAEGIAMYGIAAHNHLSAPQAELMVTNATYAGLASAALLGYGNAFDEKNTSKLAYGSIIATSLAGYGLGYGLSKLSNYTLGNAYIFSTVVPLAMYSTASYFFAQSDISGYKTFLGVEALSYAAAVYVGHQLVKNEQFTSSQGSLISLTTVGGGLFMAGLGLIINDKNTSNFSSTPILAAAGAIGGFAASYLIERGRSRDTGIGNNKTTVEMGISSISFNSPKTGQPEMAPAARLAWRF